MVKTVGRPITPKIFLAATEFFFGVPDPISVP